MARGSPGTREMLALAPPTDSTAPTPTPKQYTHSTVCWTAPVGTHKPQPKVPPQDTHV